MHQFRGFVEGQPLVVGIHLFSLRFYVTDTGLSITRSAPTVRRVHEVLAGILDVAVKDRRLSQNAARGIKLPRKVGKERAYLSHEQVAALAREAKHPELIIFLAYTGLRWGEATGLRVKNFDTLRRRISVEENAVEVGSFIEVGTPKTHEKRQVRYPEFLAEALDRLMEGKGRDDLLFGEGRLHVRRPKATTGWLNSAVRAAQTKSDGHFPRVTPHDLRHTAASLAISAGANVKAVQRMLGHASAAMTLDTHADLFDDDLDAVSDALDHAASSTSVVKSVVTRHFRGMKKPPRSQCSLGISGVTQGWAPWGSKQCLPCSCRRHAEQRRARRPCGTPRSSWAPWGSNPRPAD